MTSELDDAWFKLCKVTAIIAISLTMLGRPAYPQTPVVLHRLKYSFDCSLSVTHGLSIDKSGIIKETADPGDILSLKFTAIDINSNYAVDDDNGKWIIIRSNGQINLMQLIPSGIDVVTIFVSHSYTHKFFATETRSFTVSASNTGRFVDASEHLVGFCAHGD